MSAIIIVNWNSWEDVARCINACGHLTGFYGAVLVIDNGSTDGSLSNLKSWATGLHDLQPTSKIQSVAFLERPSVNPLSFMGISSECELTKDVVQHGLVSRGWYLIATGKNGGFGAGNNVGIRIAMQDLSCTLFWCLNADAIPRPDAWEMLLSVCDATVEPFVGGSVLLNYDRPDLIQAIGSTFSRSTLLVSYQHQDESLDVLTEFPESAVAVGYPIGASLVINRSFINECGYFDERFFLYYEEPDLVMRLASGYQSFVCLKSFVYHKGGQTTGGGSSLADRGKRADYEYNRSRVILARKIGGRTLLLVVLMSALSVLKRICFGRFDLAVRIYPACKDGWDSAK